MKSILSKMKFFLIHFYRMSLAWLHIKLVAAADAVAVHGKRMVEKERSQAVSLIAV